MKKQEIYQQLSEFYDNYQITELLLKETDFTKNQLFLCEQIDTLNQKWLDNQVKGAKSGFPFEYIIHKAEFYGGEFYVDERVLIPRDDTEVMVESVLELLTLPKPSTLDKTTPNPSFVRRGITLIDVGTGSSCIPISILNNTDKVSDTHVIDISKKALEVSTINIEKHNFQKQISQHHGNLLTPLLPLLTKEGLGVVENMIITANLPYILDKDFENIDKQTAKYEPDTALFGGPVTGFELYEKLIQQCLELKKLGNISSIDLFIEIGFDQKEYSQKYLNKLGLKHSYHKDNGGIQRCIHIII